MNKDDFAHILMCVASEIDIELMLEKRGLQLGGNLSKLFALREKVKAELAKLSEQEK